MTAENSRRTRTAKLKTANCQFASEQGEAHIINYQARPGHGHGVQGCAGSVLLLPRTHSLCIDFPVFAVSRRLSFGHGKQLPCIQKYSKISMDSSTAWNWSWSWTWMWMWMWRWSLLAERYPGTAQNGYRSAQKVSWRMKNFLHGSGLAPGSRTSSLFTSPWVPWPKTMEHRSAPPQFRQMKVALSGSMFPGGSWMSSARVSATRCPHSQLQFRLRHHPRPHLQLHSASMAAVSEALFSILWECGLKQSASVWRKLKWQSSKFKRLGCQFFRGSYSAAFNAEIKNI